MKPIASDSFQNVFIPWEGGTMAIPIPKGCHIEYLAPEYPGSLDDEMIHKKIVADLEGFADQITAARKIVLLVEDTSRPTMLESLLRGLIERLLELRHGREEIKVVVACGAHHHLLRSELKFKLGSLAVPYVIHDCTNVKELTRVGFNENDPPLYFNSEVVTADLRLSISTVNIHPMAGYSGGGKILLPGVAGLETISGFHSLPYGEPGNLENSMRALINKVLGYLPVTFSWQLLSRPDGRIIEIFGGSVETAHRLAASSLKTLVTTVVRHPADMVLAGCRPYNQNLLGTFKALVGLPGLLKDGGKLVLFNEARLGRGEHHWRNRPEVIKFQKDRAARLLEKYEVGLYSPRIKSEDFKDLFPGGFQLLQTDHELRDFFRSIPTQRLIVMPYAPVTLVSHAMGN